MYVCMYVSMYKYILGLHTASLLAVPGSFTVVSVQGLCLVHSLLASWLALNVPGGQASHLAGFPFWAGTNFLPAAHSVTDTNTTHTTHECYIERVCARVCDERRGGNKG